MILIKDWIVPLSTVFLKSKNFNLALRSKFNLFLVLMHDGDWEQVSVKSYHSVLVRFWGFLRYTLYCWKHFYVLGNFFLLKLLHWFLLPDLSACITLFNISPRRSYMTWLKLVSNHPYEREPGKSCSPIPHKIFLLLRLRIRHLIKSFNVFQVLG